jgi:hypothetical protein
MPVYRVTGTMIQTVEALVFAHDEEDLESKLELINHWEIDSISDVDDIVYEKYNEGEE